MHGSARQPAAAGGWRAAEGTYERRYRVAWLLALVYAFNFLDRQLMTILQEPIRKELLLSDTELGMLSGLAFALFYTAFGIPVAWLADRVKRVWIMAAACGLWSLFTAASGLARGFVQLAAARIAVGIGEAGGSPPSYSLISDYFPPQERATGLAIYSLGVPVGSMVGAAAGGWVAATWGWRMAFIAVGLPGLLLALALLLVREPVRGGFDPPPKGANGHGASPPLAAAVAHFFADRTLVLTAFAGGLSAFVGYAMLNWAPSFFMRLKGMSLKEVAAYYSLVLGVTGFLGTVSAGWIVDRIGRRDRRWYSWLPAIAFTLSLPFFVGFLLAPGWPLALACLAAPAMLNAMYLAPTLALVQNTAPPAQRTLASAVLLLIMNLVGLGGGPLFVGRVSDLARSAYGDRSLLIGMAALVPFILATIGAHLLTARSIGRDLRRERGG